jgi:hypothetical protein
MFTHQSNDGFITIDTEVNRAHEIKTQQRPDNNQ